MFRHDTSRALDPQLHTHAVIQNMVLGADGKWTALTNEALYENKMLLGSIYRNGLARELTELGYRIDRVGPHGIVEIRDVPRELMQGFSKRRQEIEAALKDRGAGPTAKDSALAALATVPAGRPALYCSRVTLCDPALRPIGASRPLQADLQPVLGELLDQTLAAPQGGYERALDAARRWAHEWQFRVGVHHLRGLIEAEEAGQHYADIADAAVASLAPVVAAEFARRHGPAPGHGAAVLGMGSLGARQLNASSDLDLIVIYDAAGADSSEGPKPLATSRIYLTTKAFEQSWKLLNLVQND